MTVTIEADTSLHVSSSNERTNECELLKRDHKVDLVRQDSEILNTSDV